MKKIFFPALFILIFALIYSPASASDREKTVLVTGVADGTTAKSRDEAINDALREAVRQGMGSFVDSETLVENMVLVEDRIYSETRGYIKNYKVMKENSGGNVYQVSISAVVKLGKLADDLESIGLLIQKKQNPRVMVILSSRNIGGNWYEQIREGNRNIENQIEGKLISMGFEVVDKGQTDHKQMVESAIAGDDAAKAARLAKDFGAEVLIAGDVRREYSNSRTLYGRNVRFYSNELRLKAIQADTARILYSGSGTRPASALDYIAPLEEISGRLTDEMTAAILDKWRKDVYQISTYQLNLTGASFRDMSALKKALKELRGYGGVQTRSFQADRAMLDIKYKGTLEELADKISEIKSPVMEITGFQANTIDLKVRK